MTTTTQTAANQIADYLRTTLTPEQRRELAEKFRAVPRSFLDYAVHVLKVRWTPDQIRIAQSVERYPRTLVQSANGIGKTFLSAGIALAFFDMYHPSIVLTTAPQWASVRDLLWAELAAQYKRAEQYGTLLTVGARFTNYDQGIPLVLRHTEFHYAKGHNSRTAEGFKGRHGAKVLIILDEAPGVPSYIWKAAETMLQSPDCRILAIGNPTTTSGDFYEAAHSPNWNVIRVSALDHPNVVQGLLHPDSPPPYPNAVQLSWVRAQIKEHCRLVSPEEAERNASVFAFDGAYYEPDDDFRITVLGLGPLRESAAVWAEEWVERARLGPASSSLQSQAQPHYVQLGVDVARYGNDRAVIMASDPEACRPLDCFYGSGMSTSEVTGQVIRMAARFPQARVVVCVDDDGVGGGVTDQLRQYGLSVVGVNAMSKAFQPERYPNRRSELWFNVAELGRQGQLDLSLLSEEVYRYLRADLLAPTYTFDNKGRRVIEKKEKIRRRLGRSPDFADALNLSLIQPWFFAFNGQFVANSAFIEAAPYDVELVGTY